MTFSSFFYLVGQGWRSMRANRMMTFAGIGVLTVCLVLTGAAFLLGMNVDSAVAYLGSQNETVVYLNPDLTDEQIAAVDGEIRSMNGVTGVTYVSKQDVLNTYQGYMEEHADLMEAFQEDNPFKANYRVTIEDLDNMKAISDKLAALEGVEKVSAPLELSGVFVNIQRTVTYASYALVGVLGLVSIVVISNTIRLTVFARRKEINIMKYVGATNGFIRMPFFVEGLTSGLISALIASGIVLGAYAVLLKNSAVIGSFWGEIIRASLVPMQDVWYYIMAGFAAFSFVLGGLGTASAIRKYLNV